MPLDYYKQPEFWGGLGNLPGDLADAAQIFVEGRRRKRQEEEARLRQASQDRHAMTMEALAGRTADTAERRQLAAEDFTRRQSQVAERRATAQEQRDALTFEQGQADRQGRTIRDVGRALGGGAPTQAQAIAGSSQFADPRTGEMRGVKLEPIAPPPDSGMAMPQEPKAPAFVGPLEDPESARVRAVGSVFAGQRQQGQDSHAGMVFVDQQDNGASSLDDGKETFSWPTGKLPPGAREGQWIPDPRGGREPPPFDPAKADEAARAGNAAASEVRGQQALRDQYGRETAAYPGQKAAFDAAEQEHAARVADPRYRATFPGGQSVEIDPREERKAVIAEAKGQADRLRQGAAGQPPDVARSMMLQADLIESTISNADKAPVTNMNSAVQAQGFKAGESEKDRASKVEAAKIRHAGKGLGGGRAAQIGLAELIKMKESGRPDSEIAARAAQLGIPAGGKGGWLQSTKEVLRGGAVADRQAERHAALDVTGPNGETGTAKSPAEARTLNNKNAAFAQVKSRLQALSADVQENGNRVLSPGGIQRRNSLMNAANAALRVYNGLGGTDASQRMEAEISGAAGTPGHGFLMGANPDVLQHLMTEAEGQHASNMQIRTRGGGKGAPAGKPATMTLKGRVYRLQADGSYQ